MPDYGSDEKNIISFANIGGFKADYDKSNTDLKGVALSAGVAFKSSDNIYGAFIENGYAKFNSDKDGVTSDGKIRMYGLGFFSRLNLQNDFYIDATVKAENQEQKAITQMALIINYQRLIMGQVWGSDANLRWGNSA